MPNPFKAGDKVTINPATCINFAAVCARDTTPGKAYKLDYVGLDNPNPCCTEDDVVFTDDVGCVTILHTCHVNPA